MAADAATAIGEVQSTGSVSTERHLQRACLGRATEHIVGVEELVQVEAMRDEPGRCELPGRHEAKQGRGRVRVDQSGGDGHVLDPEVF